MQHYGMQYRIGEKIKPGELNFTMDQLKNELIAAQDYENHRTNVDGAKKRAVTQMMDYNGFHQMVLGADIKPTPSRELGALFDMADKEGPEDYQNYCYIQDQANKTKKMIDGPDHLEKIELDKQAKKALNVDYILNSREFKKTMDQYYPEKDPSKDNLQKVIAELQIKIIDENLPKIFAYDFEIN